jgi:hypothetical protein
VRPCILVGTSTYGVCGHCGAPYAGQNPRGPGTTRRGGD